MASAFTRPARSLNSTLVSKRMPGHRSPASATERNSAGMPAAASAACTSSNASRGPWLATPTRSSSGVRASASSSRQSGSASASMPTYVGSA